MPLAERFSMSNGLRGPRSLACVRRPGAGGHDTGGQLVFKPELSATCAKQEKKYSCGDQGNCFCRYARYALHGNFQSRRLKPS